ncbi:MAG: hypothetical protein HS104_06240 [Polyangiaceae bacterium]|nr:hypothetical protein [Polyangiaceae bacterium]MCL4755656.1 hypothetical protein [Myxococcales bacterium]
MEALAEQVRDREAVGLDEALADMGAQLAGTEATDLRDWFECAYERSRLIAEAERYTVPDREALPPSACDTETLRSLRSTLRKSGLAQDRRAIDLEEQATGAVSNAPSDIVSHAGAVATSDARTKLRVRAATSAIESRASSQAEGELDLEAQLERLARGVQALGQDPADAAAACDVWVAHLALTFEIRFARDKARVCREAAERIDQAIALDLDRDRSERLNGYAREYPALVGFITESTSLLAVEMADAEVQAGSTDDGPDDDADPGDEEDEGSEPFDWDEISRKLSAEPSTPPSPRTYPEAVLTGLWSGTGHAVVALGLGAVSGGILGWVYPLGQGVSGQVSGVLIFGLVGSALVPAAWGCVLVLQAALKVLQVNKLVGVALLGAIAAVLGGAVDLCWGSEPVAIIERGGLLAILIASAVGLGAAAVVMFALTAIAFAIAAAFRR